LLISTAARGPDESGGGASDLPPACPFDITFPGDVLAAILLRLGHWDVINFASTCKLLRSAVDDDIKLWLPLCHLVWSPHTDIELWMVHMGDEASASTSAAAQQHTSSTQTYRCTTISC
jgi:hypothetical protein